MVLFVFRSQRFCRGFEVVAFDKAATHEKTLRSQTRDNEANGLVVKIKLGYIAFELAFSVHWADLENRARYLAFYRLASSLQSGPSHEGLGALWKNTVQRVVSSGAANAK